MNRSLKLSILMALALGSTQAAAVELGQAHIKSALGQPLLVDIPVTHATPAELQSLSAQLASNDAFAKAGGQRPSIPLQFNVVDENGHKVIRVTSSGAVDDPYLDLLVEVSSSTGSSVREFAILLDPAGSAPQQAQAPVSSAPARHRAPASSASAPAAGTTAAAPHRASAPARGAAEEVKNGEFGPVEKGATLSHVAAQVAPSGVDVNQMMLALKSANPDAFYRDNINALKAGAILRVPSRDDALATAAATAAATVHQQNSDWRNGVASTPVAVAAGGTRENASVAPTANSRADRLALVPPGSAQQGAGGAGGKGGNGTAVRQELQRSQEMLASLQQQSNDLKSRLKDLEDINTKNQRLLSLKDSEIADLQKKLADARKAAGTPAAPAANTAPTAAAANKPASAAAPVSAPHPAVAAPAPVAAAPATKPATPPAAAASAPHGVVTTPLNAPAKPKPAAQPTHRAPSPATAEQPWYMESWAWAAGGVVVLALVGLLIRRGKSGAKSPASSKGGGSLADRFGTADLEGGEPLHGADPDQDELLDQLAEQPDDIALHLELVSLYYTRRDVEHFEAAAEAMHAHITDPEQPEWQDVVHMGRDLAPGHPLFAESGEAVPAHAEQTVVRHFDLDSYAPSPAVSAPAVPAKAPSPQPAKVSEYHFDFDLTPHQPESSVRVAEPAVKEPEQEEEPISTWKFDEPAETEAAPAVHTDHDTFGELHDDPVDTKLDLARAYLDMGDPEGARAMLEEVLHEGSQMQQDVARQLMDKLH